MNEDGKEINLNTKKVRLWFYISGTFFVLSFVLLMFILFFVNFSEKDNEFLEMNSDDSKNFSANLFPRLIDGVMVEEENINPPVAAVMIDNHIDARPPAGIEKANLVFEAEAEGGITRYLTFYTVDQEIGEIGPIRSARPYFIDWAKELRALYVHVGGSPAALVKLKKEKVFHINEFFNESYFWRDKVNFAPHNVFSSFRLLKEYINRYEVERSEFEAWNFLDEKEMAERKDSHDISIAYKDTAYSVEWRYDKENNYYIRFLSGTPHQTRSNEIITAKNVVIMIVDSKEIDDKLRLEMDSVGNGDAQVCYEGGCVDGVWEKTSSDSRTMFYKNDGSEISFVRGNTWIEVVKPGYEIDF